MALLPGGSGGLGGGATTNTQINVTTNIDQSVRQFNQLNQTINNFSRQASTSASRASRAMEDFGLHMRRVNANVVLAGFALVGLGAKVSDFIERGAKMEMFSKRMEGVSGSIKDATKDMDQIIKLAQNVPFKLEAVTRSFIKMKSAGLDPITDAQGNGPLKSLIDAMAAFGGDSDLLDRATIALTQMAGKGVVSMEELRQQLGEAIPTALRIAAREMNMTVASFVKDVSKGKITWEEFAKVFFTGLDKNYAGAAARLMDTFTGATQQLDTQLDILAKTIFVDTGTMRYFTAAIQVATDKLKELGEYLSTAEGQEYVKELVEGFKEFTLYVARGLEPLKDIYQAIKRVGSAIADVTGALPEEIVVSGLIGYIFFGRAGLVVGAVAGAFGEELNQAAPKVAEFIKKLDGIFNEYGGSLSNAAIGGLIGFRLAGPAGALAGALNGAFVNAEDGLEGYIQKVILGSKIIWTALNDSELMNSWSFDKIGARFKEIAVELAGESRKAISDAMAGLGDEVAEKANLETAGKTIEGQVESGWAAIEAKLAAKKERIVNVVEGMSSELVAEASKIPVNLADQELVYADKEEALSKLADYFHTINAYIFDQQEKIQKLNVLNVDAANTGADNTAIEEALAKQEELLKKAVEVRTQIEEQFKNIKLMPEGGLAGETSQLLTDIENFAAGIETSFQSVDTMKAKLAEWAQQEDVLRERIEASNLSTESKTELLNALTKVNAELADSEQAVADKATQLNPVFQENGKAVAELNRKLNDLEQKGRSLTLGKSWTGEAERMGEASNQIQSYLDDIAVAIEDTQSKADRGLISQETANATIARLQAMAGQVENARGRIVNAASDANQAWQEAGRAIYSAIESALGDAIYNLVTGAKSMKEVLLDLWRSVTRAISNYIAKLIMASLFGGGSSGGGIFGSIFGANTGAQLSFAGGGMVDGRTGFDNNMVSMRVSRGERVTVETAAQQRANKRGGGGDTFIIQAWDGVDVERVLMKHGGAVQSAVKHQLRLNRQ